MISKEDVTAYLVERIIQRDDMIGLLERLKGTQCMACEVVANVAWISPTNPTLRLSTSGVDKESNPYYRAFFIVSQEVYDCVENEPVLISYKDLLDYKTLMDM